MPQAPDNKSLYTSLDLVGQPVDEWLARTLDMIPQLIFAKDLAGRYVMVNSEVEKLFGMPRSAILGKTDIELNRFPGDQERFTREDEEIIATGREIIVDEEKLAHAESGSERWYHTWKRPLFDNNGQVAQILGIGIDITERRTAEQALHSILLGTASKTAEDFFKSVVFHLAKVLNTKFGFISRLRPDSNVCDTLAVWQDGKFIENSSYLANRGPTGQILGNDFKLYSEGVARLFATDTHLIENRIESYMGATIWDSQGRVLGILSVMDDKPMKPWEPARNIMRIFADRIGAELERLEKELSVRELQENLLQSQKLEALGRLSAGIAHDLNNALSAVVGHLEILASDASLRPPASNSVRIALDGCQRASGLIEQLLGYSRQGKYEVEQVDCRYLVNETLSFLERVIPKNIQVERNFSAEATLIEADLGQIQQALTNIVINACQAMPNGGKLTIAISSAFHANPEQFNSAAKPGDFVCIGITDTGSGIPKDHLTRVFEPFFTTKSGSHGTGLGLPMVYGTMQNHSGWIDIQSEIGQGTACFLYLPLREATNVSSVIEKEQAVPTQLPLGKHILFVDDEPTLVDLGIQFAKRSGFMATGFDNPEEALKWFADHSNDIDLAVIDMKMPGFSGERCFEAFRAIDPEAKIILLSGYSQDTAVQELLNKGALKFFQKPIKYSDLMEWLREYFVANADTKEQTVNWS